jgi:hypothetical protein
VQLEALRLRGFGAQAYAPATTQAVFADISRRATDLLAAELREARVTAEVAAEMVRILRRLLASLSVCWPSLRPRREFDCEREPGAREITQNVPARLG